MDDGTSEASDAPSRPNFSHSPHSDHLSIGAESKSSFSDPEGDISDISSTRSASDSIFNFIRENGRTYHSHMAGSYFLPNDAPENERLDHLFYLFRYVLNSRDFIAPVKNPKSVLDIGTGTGKWAIEVGEKFKDAEVIGTDLSPIQPEWAPPNVRFIVDDACHEDWGSQSYSFIHTRMLLSAFEDFKSIIKRSFDHLEPGGWMESQEPYPKPFSDDGSLAPDDPFYEWYERWDEAAMLSYRPLRIANKMKRWYEEAGFVDVKEVVFKLPIGPWPREERWKLIGKCWQNSVMDGLQGFSLAFFHRAFGWSKEEIEVYLVNVRKALMNKNIHSYHKFYVVYGRKPGGPPTPARTSEEVQSRRAKQQDLEAQREDRRLRREVHSYAQSETSGRSTPAPTSAPGSGLGPGDEGNKKPWRPPAEWDG